MRRIVLILSLVGAGLFAGAFVVSLARPMLVEQVLRELLRIELQHRVEGTLDKLSETRFAGLAGSAVSRDRVAAQVATVVTAMSDPDCECRRRLAAYAAQPPEGKATWLLRNRARLSTLIESAYASVSASLLREFRIFTASNALAFGLLALVALVRRKAGLQLLAPALVIAGAVAISAGLYLFNQDWLHTIVFADYLGLGYAAYLAGVALLLADIALNRARISTHVVNAAASVLGSAACATPC